MELTILNLSLLQVEYLMEDTQSICVVKQELNLKSILSFIKASGLNLLPFDNGSDITEIALDPETVFQENKFDIIKRYLNFNLN